jgi:hypothetical protein
MYDLDAARRGWAINRLGHRLRLPEERARLKADEAGYLAAAGLAPEELAAIQARDWPGLSARGASIYALAKLGGALGVPLPRVIQSFREQG